MDQSELKKQLIQIVRQAVCLFNTKSCLIFISEISRGIVFKTLSNVYDGALLRRYLTVSQKVSS